MLYQIIGSLGWVALGQTPAASSETNGATIGLVIVAIVASGLYLWTRNRLQLREEKVNTLTTNLENQTNEARKAATAERKAQSELAEKTEKIAKQKRDLAAQRKKTYTVTEELKEARQSHRDQVTRLEKKVAHHGAFDTTATPTKAKVKVKAKETEPEQPTPVSAPVAEAAPADTPANEALESEISRLQKENENLTDKLAKERSSRTNMRDELKENRLRVERYRRVDILSKNRVELLEDRLLTYGRQYYDVLSEVAALKGNVTPPRPRDLVEAEEKALQKAKLAEQEAVHSLEDHDDLDDAPVQLDFHDEEEETETAEAPEAPETLELSELAEVSETPEVSEPELPSTDEPSSMLSARV